jgi:hypothetical protein
MRLTRPIGFSGRGERDFAVRIDCSDGVCGPKKRSITMRRVTVPLLMARRSLSWPRRLLRCDAKSMMMHHEGMMKDKAMSGDKMKQ